MQSPETKQIKIVDLPNVPAGFTFKPKQDWHEYDLHTFHVMHENRPTDLQAIVYKGNFITFRHKNYFVFPHEDLFAEIDNVMQKIGGQSDSSTIPESRRFSLVYGANKKTDVEANYKVFDGKKYYFGSRVRANYTFNDEKFDVTGNGDVVKFGMTAFGAIDGTASMSLSPYSFRQTCSNGMMHNATVMNISENIIQNLLKKHEAVSNESLIQQHIKDILEESNSFDSLIQKIKNEKMSHLTKIPIEWVTSRVYLIKESIGLFKTRYRQMTEMLTTLEQAQKLALNLPVRLVDKLDWLSVTETDKEVKTSTGMMIVKIPEVKILKETTQWKAFNDITEDLTHNQRAFDSVTKHYRTLDQALVVSTQ